jgi:hypothetical protein
MFTKATKSQSRGRIAFMGSSGSGKTYTSLKVAEVLAQGGKVAVIDSERGSASKYASIFDFDVLNLDAFSPEVYIQAILAAETAGYAVCVIDSLTHAWSGVGGALEMVDQAVARSRSSNSFAAWREVTPVHNRLVDTMLRSRCHIITTMRTKTEYVLEEDARGKKTPRKIGMAPIQRDGMEYEFDIVGDMDADNRLIISKTRCPELRRAVIETPGKEFATTILNWLTDGVEAPEPAKPEFTLPEQPKQKPTTEQAICATHTPAALASLLRKWLEKNPVGSAAEKWQAYMEAAENHQIKMIDAGKWTKESADESNVIIMSIYEQLATAAQGQEVFP